MAADKTKTIKGATDKELDALIERLGKEVRLQDLVASLKRNGLPNGEYLPYGQSSVSTEAPIESLYHFGILGMHWGRRKAQQPGSDEHERAVGLRKKGAANLTNAELKALNERMQLEKTFKELKKADISPGKAFVQKTLRDAGSEAAKNFTSKALGVGIGIAGKAASKGLTKLSSKATGKDAKAVLDILAKLMETAG